MSLGGESFNQFATQSVNIFIKETFPGAIKLEEHQVSQPAVAQVEEGGRSKDDHRPSERRMALFELK